MVNDLRLQFQSVLMQFLCFPQVLKVHLSDQPDVYGKVEVTGDKVNKNLLFDSRLQHLYITTEKQVKLTQTLDGLIIMFH